MTDAMTRRDIALLPTEMRRLVDLCKQEMKASEVWLFGSRARGDCHKDSDYDVLAIIPDDVPAEVDTPVAAFRLRRKSKAHADLLTARLSDFVAARGTPNTISYTATHEGVRLDT
jgi:uncharacterized protein